MHCMAAIGSHLSNRSQSLVVNETYSNRGKINANVSQRSVLGSLLFLLFINYIVADINFNVRIFADDTYLYTTVKDQHKTTEQ